MDVNQLLDAAKSAHGLSTDSALAERLKVTKQAVSNWRQGSKLPDVVACERLAEMAGIKPLAAISMINELRAVSSEEKKVWRRLASAAALFLAVALPYPGHAKNVAFASQNCATADTLCEVIESSSQRASLSLASS